MSTPTSSSPNNATYHTHPDSCTSSLIPRSLILTCSDFESAATYDAAAGLLALSTSAVDLARAQYTRLQSEVSYLKSEITKLSNSCKKLADAGYSEQQQRLRVADEWNQRLGLEIAKTEKARNEVGNVLAQYNRLRQVLLRLVNEKGVSAEEVNRMYEEGDGGLKVVREEKMGSTVEKTVTRDGGRRAGLRKTGPTVYAVERKVLAPVMERPNRDVKSTARK